VATTIKLCFRLLGITALLGLAACSTTPVQQGEVISPVFSAEDVLGEDVTYAGDIYDPWQGFNRAMYRFNYRFDKYIMLPSVKGYQAITPDFAEKGVHNFVNNIKSISTIINSALQLHGKKTLQTTGRFAVNTTIGILGLFDVATRMDIPHHREDFGQTLGRWGVGNGPYIVLPLLGPSNLRDATGIGVDWWAFNEIDVMDFDDHEWRRLVYGVLNALDTRANVAFRYYETGSPLEYRMVRMLYTTKRQLDVAK